MNDLGSDGGKAANNISSSFDVLGLYALIMLLILNPFHSVVSDKCVYYREFFAAFYSILSVRKLFAGEMNLFGKHYALKNELFSVILFPLLLVLFAVIDPGVNLYGSDITQASLQLKTVSPTLYVLRNAFLYIPMIFYFALRGFSEDEIKKIAFVIVMVAPLSIIVSFLQFMTFSDIVAFKMISVLVKLGGAGIQSNSYVPYLTFPVLSAMYLLASNTSNVMKGIVFGVLITLTVYLLLATSRQSVLFVGICGAVFLIKNNSTSLLKKTIFLISFLMVLFVTFHLVTRDVNFNNGKEAARYNKVVGTYSTVSGATQTTRLMIAKDGLTMLKGSQYLIGAGLTSVINSGPHNDYIRWLQRVGLIVMLFGFFPFLTGAFGTYRYSRRLKDNSLGLYLFLSISFTLYYSLFGYPREDAYEALYCFLGIAMWVGVGKNMFFVETASMLKNPKRFSPATGRTEQMI
jgi:hypothetical protein